MRIRLLLALLLTLVLVLSACAASDSGQPEETATPTGTTAAEAVEDVGPTAEIAEAAEVEVAPTETSAPEATAVSEQTPVITVGINAEFEPFAYIDANGNLAGFDIDLMNALNAEMDFEVAYVNTTFDALLQGLENDELDAAISAITITDKRKERVDFTNPYFASGLSPVSYFSPGQGLAVRTDNQAINGVDSLTEETIVGVKRNTTGNDFVADNSVARVEAYDEAKLVLQALVNGEVDAIVLDTPVIIRFIKANPGAALKLVGGPLTVETYGIAVNKNRPRVLESLNEGLEKLFEDGVYDAIYNKWFGAP